MRTFALPLVLSALALPQLAAAQDAAARTDAKADPHWSLSLERFASANAVFFSTKDGSDELKLRSKGITAGGPISNPLSAPRLAVDYLSDSGLTFGVGLAAGLGDLDSKESGEKRDEGGYNLLMVAPRVGYRIEVADWLDLTPRAGVTVGWASFTGGEEESCDYDYDEAADDYVESCHGKHADSVNMFAAIANLELAAAWRLSDSFNLLTGLSYDMVVAARAGEKDGYSGDKDSESFKDGHLSSLQLWLGLGGYL